MLIDSHCHLDRLKVSEEPEGLASVMQRAWEAGVEGFLCVGINLERWPEMLEATAPFNDVWLSVGVHPSETEGEEPTVERLVELAATPRVVAIGETGLDYYWGRDEEAREIQRARFRTHIAAARRTGKPIIVHTRDAREDTIAILREAGAAEAGGVMHCFTETWEMARQALDLGFYISFSGIVTFRNAEALREVVRKMPADRILVETDSPYLAPVPMRGKPNEPAWVRYVAECVAEVRGESLEALAEATTRNFHTLFTSSNRQDAKTAKQPMNRPCR